MYCVDTVQEHETLYSPQRSEHLCRPSGLLGSSFGGKVT